MTQSVHVQQSTALLAILPSIAHGANCVVLTCIGLFEADPLGASKHDILDYTGLSRQTVETALRFLEKSDLIEYHPATKSYHAKQFYRFGAEGKVKIRDLVPIIQGEARSDETCRKVFNNPSSSSTIQSSSEIESTPTTTRACEKLLQSANVRTVDLDLSEMDAEHAQAIAEYIAQNPDRKRSPAGFVYAVLKNNPRWSPPKPLFSLRDDHFGDKLTRADFTDAQWRRLSPLNRRSIIAEERGCDVSEVAENEL